jgi:hypothetical protein
MPRGPPYERRAPRRRPRAAPAAAGRRRARAAGRPGTTRGARPPGGPAPPCRGTRGRAGGRAGQLEAARGRRLHPRPPGPAPWRGLGPPCPRRPHAGRGPLTAAAAAAARARARACSPLTRVPTTPTHRRCQAALYRCCTRMPAAPSAGGISGQWAGTGAPGGHQAGARHTRSRCVRAAARLAARRTAPGPARWGGRVARQGRRWGAVWGAVCSVLRPCGAGATAGGGGRGGQRGDALIRPGRKGGRGVHRRPRLPRAGGRAGRPQPGEGAAWRGGAHHACASPRPA